MVGGIQGNGAGHQHPSAQQMFKKMDTNGDGSLDVGELQAAKAKHGGKGPDAQDMMDKADANHDGKIDESESEAAFAKMHDEIKKRHEADKAKGDDQDADGKSLMDLLKTKPDSEGATEAKDGDSMLSKLQSLIQAGTQYAASGEETNSVHQAAVDTQG